MDFNSIAWQRRSRCCASPTWDDGLTNFLRKSNAFSEIFAWFLGRKRQVNIESTTSRVIISVEKDCLQNWVFDSSRFLIGFLFMFRFVYSFQLLWEMNTCRVGREKREQGRIFRDWGREREKKGLEWGLGIWYFSIWNSVSWFHP